MSLNELIELSRYYGSNPEYVLAGGGNTSWKDENEGVLYVKGSGTSLAEAAAGTFVKMDRKALALIWKKQYPESNDEREKAVLADMMAARKPGIENEQKRPSVEALLHDLLPFSFVVHLHPALVNGLTCSQRGEEAFKEIFTNNEFIWMPSINPGYILSRAVKTIIDDCGTANKKPPSAIFMQNHGVFVGADTVDSIKELYGDIIKKIGACVKRQPDFSGERGWIDSRNSTVAEVNKILTKLSGGVVFFMHSNEVASLVQDRESFAKAASAFTPDHIVYSGSDPLFVTDTQEAGFASAWEDHVQKTGRNPKVVAVQGLGVFSAAATEKAAGLALELFKDTIKVAVYSESFGGPLFMTRDKIDFINNWEVERFRSAVSTK